MVGRAIGLALLAAGLYPALTAAQSLGAAQVPGISLQRNGPPTAAPPLPKPTGTHQPHRPPPSSATGEDRDLFRAGPRTYAPRYDRLLPRGPYGYGFPYGGYVLPYGYTIGEASELALAPATPVTGGYLRVLVPQRTAQMYVDGEFVGTVRELDEGVFLVPGSHRIELRTPELPPHAFNVRIRANETITYRDDLARRVEATSADEPPPTRVAVAKTLYVIPRCYAGDKPPRADELRPGCSLDALRVLPPPTP